MIYEQSGISYFAPHYGNIKRNSGKRHSLYRLFTLRQLFWRNPQLHKDAGNF